MKKRFVAFICIVVLLLWPLAGCKKPNDPALDESFAGMQEDNKQLFLPEISVENTEENVDPDDVLAKNEDVVENDDINIKENNADQPTDIEDPTSSELTEKPMDKIYTTPSLEENFVPGEVLVLLTYAASDFYEGLSADSFSCVEYLSVEWSNPCTPETVETLANPSMYRQRYHIVLKEQTKQAVLDAIKELEKLDFVYCAEPNYTYTFEIPEVDISEQRALSLLGDTNVASSNGGYYPAAYTDQYAIDLLNLPAAWHVSNGTANTIKVGILDSGIDKTHPDINIPNGRWGDDYTNKGTDPYVDEVGHGTHVAGIVGATATNSVGISGVSWNVELYSLKVFYKSIDDNGKIVGKGNINFLAGAIDDARIKGIHLLNYSGGGWSITNSFITALNNFPGLLIAAAGNYNSKEHAVNTINNDAVPFYPASYKSDKIISVASTNSNDQLAATSHYGATTVDLAAPGVSINSTVPGGDYATMSGTSMAAPQVTGVAALIWSLNPSMTAAQVKQSIMNGVDSVSGLSGKCVTGGRLNAFKAVTYALNHYNPPGVLSGDVTGDGLDDLVVSGSFNGKRKLSVFRGQSTGGFGQAVHTFSEATFVYNDVMHIGDVTGDGKDDLVIIFANAGKRAFAVYTAKGDGSFYERITSFSTRVHNQTTYPCKLYLKDTTGDGKADFVVHWRTTDGKRKFLVYKGYTSGGKGYFYEGVDSAVSVFNYVDSDPTYMGDVNGDGRADFVIHWSENNKRRLLTYTAKADGTFAEGAMLYSVRTHDPNTYPCSFHLADATGDGKMDFLVHWKNTEGKRNIMIYKGISSSGTANFEEGYYALSSTRAYIGTDPVYMGDFNGDGRSDQMVHYAINGIRNMLVYFANASGNYNEAIQISTTQQQNLTTYPCTVHIMNTNGDARDDFVVRYRTTEWRTAFHAYKGTTGGFAASVPTTATFFPYYIYY